jgi:hypothetical protein
MISSITILQEKVLKMESYQANREGTQSSKEPILREELVQKSEENLIEKDCNMDSENAVNVMTGKRWPK